MYYLRHLFAIVFSLGLIACTSTHAPVIDRLPANKPNVVNKSNTKIKPPAKTSPKVTGDWRPDIYTVKKGDTLFSIGLEYGYDYKEIAQANEISAPYTIKIGQVLKFSALKEKPTTESKPAPQENTDGVVTYPLNAEPNAAKTTPTATSSIVVLSEPKAIREPYSDEAFKKPLPTAKPITDKIPAAIKPATKPLNEKSVINKPDAEPKPSTEIKSSTESKVPDAKPETKLETKSNNGSADSLDWAWPAKGKIIGNFNEAGNKGMDIAGNMGQSIQAAATGKVIYSGSDLRGYGKLVIIKHNANYLSVYANNSVILVKEGQQVSRGQQIAEMGNTDSNTVKLHFEIRQQGKSVDPSKLLP